MKFLYVGDHAETLETGRPIAPWELYEEDEPSETTERWLAEGKARHEDHVEDGDTNVDEIKSEDEPDEGDSPTETEAQRKKREAKEKKAAEEAAKNEGSQA